MPVDEEGTRADIVMDSGGTVSRMNIGRLYEQYHNSAAKKAAAIIRSKANNQKINKGNTKLVKELYGILLQYLEIVKSL